MTRIHLDYRAGVAVKNSKLCDADVRAIRKLADLGWPLEKIAARFPKVTTSCVRNVLNGRTWSHVEDEVVAEPEPTVELEPAFAWKCACGKKHLVESVKGEPPGVVRCWRCGREFKT